MSAGAPRWRRSKVWMEEKVESRVASGPSSPSRSGGDAAKLCFGAEGAERESRVASREPELGPDPCLPLSSGGGAERQRGGGGQSVAATTA